MAELRIALNSTIPSGVGNNEIVLYPTNNNGGELNVIGSDGQPKRLLTDLTTLNEITVSDPIKKTGTATAPNISLPNASVTANGAMSKFDKAILNDATSDNISSSLVKRDNSGSFSANVITANRLEGTSASTELIPVLNGAISSDGVSNTTTLNNAVIENINIKPGAAIDVSKLSVNPTLRSTHQGTQSFNTISDFSDGVFGYLTNNPISNSNIASNAGILMSQLQVNPLDRANHIGANPANNIDDLDTAVTTIINSYFISTPLVNNQITPGTISLNKLAVDVLNRDNHTGTLAATNLTGLQAEIFNNLVAEDGIDLNSTAGTIGVDLDPISLKFTASGIGISDTYITPISGGGTGKSGKAKSMNNLRSISNVNADTTLNYNYEHVLVSTTSSDVTITLPSASAEPAKYFIKKKSTANLVNIVVNGSDTIEGQTSLSLTNQYDYVVLQTDGSDLWVIWNSKGI